MEKKKPWDFWLFVLAIALLVIGILMVFDSSYARAGQIKFTNGDSFFFAKRQAVFAVIGLVFLLIAMHIKYWKLRGSISLVLLIMSICGLLAVLVPGIGVQRNGAMRWIDLGPVPVQPSEFAKLCLILYLADYLATKRREMRDWRQSLVVPLACIGIMGALIMKEPDMGTTIILASSALAMVFIAGARKQHMALVLTVMFVLGTVLIFSSGYRRDRVISFLDPFKDYHGDGYQVCQSLIGLGSGGPLGAGLCESKIKLFYLPAGHTDFIFAVLGEEAGLWGTVGLALLFLAFAIRGLRIAQNTKDPFGRLLASGLSVMIGGQALLNMLVVTSSVPATGVPLPFISYGGSSLVLNLMCVGIILGISQYPRTSEDCDHEGRTNRGRHRRPRVSRA